MVEDTRPCGMVGIATDGLEEPARQRIAIEIGAHYAEAVSSHLSAGEPGLSAQAAALAELGDPQAAALNFRKSHLTEPEAKAVKWMEWSAAKPLCSFWALLLDGLPLAVAALFISHLLGIGNPRHLFEPNLSAALLLLSYAGLRLIPRLLFVRMPRRNSLRSGLALCRFTTQVVVLPACWLVHLPLDHSMFAAFDAVFVCYLYGYACNPGFRIWNKLRKMGDEWNEQPPSKTPAS